VSKLRSLAWIVVALVVIVLIADQLLRRTSLETYRGEIEARLSRALGADVAVSGNMHLELVPRLHVEVEGITVANLRGRYWSQRLEIGRLWLDLDEWSLLDGVVSIDAIDVSGAVLQLASDDVASELDDLEQQTVSEAGPDSGLRAELRHLRLENVSVRHGGPDVADEALHLERLTVDTAGPSSRMQAEAVGSVRANPFELTANLGSADELFDLSTPYPLDAVVRIHRGDSGKPVELEVDGEFAASKGAESTASGVHQSDRAVRWQGHVAIGDSHFDGHWEASFGRSGRRRVTATAESPHLSLAEIGSSEPGSESDEKSWFTRWWSGGEALPLDLPKAVDLDLELRAKQVSGPGGFELANAQAEFRLDGAELGVRDFSAQYEGGRVDASLSVGAQSDRPVWNLSMTIDSVDLTRILALLPLDESASDGQAGKLDMALQLHSRGSTRAAMTSALHGWLGATVRNASLITRYGEAVTKDFLGVAVPEILQLHKRTAGPRVRCLLAVAPIDKGIASLEQFYLDSDHVTVVGTGRIDLPADQLNLRLVPRVHDPGLVSVAATVDVTGPLEAPRFSPVIASLATSAARSLFDNAMRPVRVPWLGGLADEAAPSGDPCDSTTLSRMRPR